MPDNVNVNVQTGFATVVPMTAADLAAQAATEAASVTAQVAVDSARANAQTLTANALAALTRLRQIQNANPATVTLPQVAQAVSDLAADVIHLARLVLNVTDATT